MPDTNDLAEHAKRYALADQSLAPCWKLVLRAIDVGWLDRDELRDLIAHLREHRDFGVEQLLFAHVGDRLRVTFLHEEATCTEASLLGALEGLAIAAGE